VTPRSFWVNGVQNAWFTDAFTAPFTSLVILTFARREGCGRRYESLCTRPKHSTGLERPLFAAPWAHEGPLNVDCTPTVRGNSRPQMLCHQPLPRTPFAAALYCPPDSGYCSPEQFQPELNLPGSGAGGRDDPGGWGWPSGCRCKHNRIWCVEVRVIEQIEYFCAELHVQSLGK
jgi:hypothetical protein